jgi:membrane protease YdiL (CAAX protease family)
VRAAARPLLPALGIAAAVGVALAARLVVAGGGAAAVASLPAAAVFAAVMLGAAVLLRLRLSPAALPAGGAPASWRPSLSSPVRASRMVHGLAFGVAGGGVLVALTLLLPGLPLHVWPRPSGGDAVLWTLLVAAVGGGEELVFRGVLFDAVARIGGAVCAAVVCAVAFALLHVPLYGWRVLPLDVGAGLWLGGLRMLSGGVAAPAVAHVVADCGAWLVL